MSGLRFLSARVGRLTLTAVICAVAVLAQSAVAGASPGGWGGFGDHGGGQIAVRLAIRKLPGLGSFVSQRELLDDSVGR